MGGMGLIFLSPYLQHGENQHGEGQFFWGGCLGGGGRRGRNLSILDIFGFIDSHLLLSIDLFGGSNSVLGRLGIQRGCSIWRARCSKGGSCKL